MFDIEAYEAASQPPPRPSRKSRLRAWLYAKRHPYILVPADERLPIIHLTRAEYRRYVRLIAAMLP